LVNLNYVEQITDNRIRINGEYLPLSRRRKKSFKEALNLYLGGDR
jgi:DNA-binding LytR/AlgR family response regulator